MIDVDEIKRRWDAAKCYNDESQEDERVDELRALCVWLVAECDEEAIEVSCGCMGSNPLAKLTQLVEALA